MKITLNKNTTILNKNTTIAELLSLVNINNYLYDFYLNKKKINRKYFSQEIKDGSSIEIKLIKSKKNIAKVSNITRFKLFFLSKARRVKARMNIPIIRSYIANALNPIIKIDNNNTQYLFFGAGNSSIIRANKLLSSEIDTINWLNKLDSSNVLLDVGANIGTYTIYAAKNGVKVVSCEPLWNNFSVLCKNIEINNLNNIVYPVFAALTDKQYMAELLVSSSKAGASCNTIEGEEAQSFKNSDSLIFNNVMAISGNHLFKKFNLPIPTHIKIDVDGIEEKVIDGCDELFSNKVCKSVLVETSLLEYKAVDNIINNLTCNGFSLTHVQGIKMNHIDLTKINNMRGALGTMNLIFSR